MSSKEFDYLERLFEEALGPADETHTTSESFQVTQHESVLSEQPNRLTSELARCAFGSVYGQLAS